MSMTGAQAPDSGLHASCPGPLIWFDVEPGPPHDLPAAVLECGTCGHITVTGNWNQSAHAYTPILRGT